MKKIVPLLICISILLLLQLPAAADDLAFRPQYPVSGIVPVSQQRALKQRADQIIETNDALIQRTIQANGGNYFHQGTSKILIFNHKIYKDFTIRIINGNRLIIETDDGAFQMDVHSP